MTTMSIRPTGTGSMSSPWMSAVNRAIVNGSSQRMTSCCGLKRARVVSACDIPLEKRARPADILDGLNPEEVETQRRTMAQQLELRVKKAQGEGRVAKGVCTSAFAQGLEKTMFKQAGSFQEHIDLNTLDARLSELCAALAKRRQTKKQEPSNFASLKLHLGNERYTRVMALAQQAQALKFSWSQTGCFSSGPPSVAAATNGVMPEPIRKFFFGTRLLTISARPNLIPKLEVTVWDEIVAEAEENMAKYEAWSSEHPATCCRKPSPPRADKDSSLEP